MTFDNAELNEILKAHKRGDITLSRENYEKLGHKLRHQHKVFFNVSLHITPAKMEELVEDSGKRHSRRGNYELYLALKKAVRDTESPF